MKRVHDGIAKHNIPRLEVKDPLLFECLAYGKYVIPNEGRSTGVFTQGGYLLQYLSDIAFNHHRFPFCADRMYSGTEFHISKQGKIQELLCSLSDERIDAMVSELKEVHDHCVSVLKGLGLTHIPLRRAVSEDYAGRISRLFKSAKLLEHQDVKVSMDSICSFTQNKRDYLSSVDLKVLVPVENVLVTHQLIQDVNRTDYAESAEWLILNLNRDGLVKIPVDSIHLDESLYADRFPHGDVRLAEEFLRQNQAKVTFMECGREQSTWPVTPSRKKRLLLKLTEIIQRL